MLDFEHSLLCGIYSHPFLTPMGTLTNWAEVAGITIFWAGIFLLWEKPYRQRKGYTPVTSWEDVLGFGFAGLAFGIFMTFHWERALHPPLVFLTVGSLLASFIFQRIRRRKHATRERS
jgi:hypothetical protein